MFKSFSKISKFNGMKFTRSESGQFSNWTSHLTRVNRIFYSVLSIYTFESTIILSGSLMQEVGQVADIYLGRRRLAFITYLERTNMTEIWKSRGNNCPIKRTAIRFILDKTNEILINYESDTIGSNKIHIRGLMETN